MFVTDASVVLEWLLPGQASDISVRAYALARKGPVVVPSLWLWETQNAILTSVRRKLLSSDRAREIRAELSLLSIRIDQSSEPYLIDRTWDIATRNMMTFYDASYVELASRLGLKLASSDHSIQTAARRLKIQLV